MPTLFDDQSPPPAAGRDGAAADAPLAERLRPRSLDEVVGQDEVVGERGFLRRAIADDRVPSMVFWGPPGTGKTTIARIVAAETSSRFVPFSAVTSGIKEVKQVMADAARLRHADAARRTLVFVDEIHRFNRAQQDAFLPYVESGDIVLVGATTENPSFEVNAALLSRCRVVVLNPLSPQAVEVLVRRALEDAERGLGAVVSEASVELDEDALQMIVQLSSGDARKALNLLELAVADAASDGGGALDAETVERLAQKKVLLYDKAGEEHFNLISALHKSLRESDPDAAVYWLARMLEAGEDPLYVVRRLVRFASEDVGLADPRALRQTLDAWDAYDRLGTPEGELAIAQAAVYLAAAPKSNAVYKAYGAARKTVAERPADPVPKVIRNAPTRLMKGLGYGAGYVYAHDAEDGVGGLDCLPEALQGTRFYQPTDRGIEARVRQRLEEIRRLRQKAVRRHRSEGG
jgi:putative ATPase